MILMHMTAPVMAADTMQAHGRTSFLRSNRDSSSPMKLSYLGHDCWPKSRSPYLDFDRRRFWLQAYLSAIRCLWKALDIPTKISLVALFPAQFVDAP